LSSRVSVEMLESSADSTARPRREAPWENTSCGCRVQLGAAGAPLAKSCSFVARAANRREVRHSAEATAKGGDLRADGPPLSWPRARKRAITTCVSVRRSGSVDSPRCCSSVREERKRSVEPERGVSISGPNAVPSENERQVVEGLGSWRPRSKKAPHV